MRILILAPNYLPDLGPSAPLFTMLSESLVQRGHDVTVITAVPHYPTGIVPIEFRKKWLQSSTENGVSVIRVRLPSVSRKSLIKRFLQFIFFQVGATLAGMKYQWDAAIIANPALQVWLPFFWIVSVKRIPTIYSVHDVYPDVGITLGIFKSKLQIALVRWMEKYCLQHATIIRILSESFKPGLKNLDVSESKMSLIYDWVDTSLIRPLPRENQFSQQNGIDGNFVVEYAGNIGLSQGLENILSAADLLLTEKDVRFVLVGDGTGKDVLQAKAEQMKLDNVKFLPFQPRERLPEVLACAGISLVILKHDIGTASLPSKIFSIMASGRPILISVDEDSESWRIINHAEAGVWIPAEDPSHLAEAILSLSRDSTLRDQLGFNGRVWAEQHHSPQKAAEQFENLLNHAIRTEKG